MTDIPMCGYEEGGIACRQAVRIVDGQRTARCQTHSLRICFGCGSLADHNCEGSNQFGRPCDVPVCGSCLHLDEDIHGPRPAGAFTGQRPTGPSAAELAREAMISSIRKSLEDLAHRGFLRLHTEAGEDIPQRTAAVILDNLSASVLMQSIGGMLAAQMQP
jgi:hypothetical protein